MSETESDSKGEHGSFLGKGWGFPPRFGPGGATVDMVEGAEDISQSLEILLSTALGERVMRPDFGCDLSAFQFEPVSQALVNDLTAIVSNAIVSYEPRIHLEAVDVSDDDAVFGRLTIRVDYTVRATNSRYNLVFPFYLQEATRPGA
ncbi:MAG: GPW/gp25 family protein [Myxococcota bacterium]